MRKPLTAASLLATVAILLAAITLPACNRAEVRIPAIVTSDSGRS